MTNLEKLKTEGQNAAVFAYLCGAHDLLDILRLFPEGQIALSDQRIISHFDVLTKLAINDQTNKVSG